jgi:hypothetical protein
MSHEASPLHRSLLHFIAAVETRRFLQGSTEIGFQDVVGLVTVIENSDFYMGLYGQEKSFNRKPGIQGRSEARTRAFSDKTELSRERVEQKQGSPLQAAEQNTDDGRKLYGNGDRGDSEPLTQRVEKLQPSLAEG